VTPLNTVSSFGSCTCQLRFLAPCRFA
jgi:hypothetical protein